MSESRRIHLSYSGPTELPSTLIAKFESASESSRQASQLTRTYEIETAFYRTLASRVDVRAPQCFASHYDPDSDEFLLLLEDFAPCYQGDQISGCSPGEARVAVEELARLHGPVWNAHDLESREWLHRNTPEKRLEYCGLVKMLYPGFVDRYSNQLSEVTRAVGDAFIATAEPYFTFVPPHFTVVHGDYRLDNILFMPRPEGLQVGVVDFQTLSLGCGLSDLSYFIGAGLLPDDRRAHEQDLVRTYVDGISGYNIDLSFDEAWHLYRRFTLSGFIMAVIASMLVKQTERGDAMFLAMAQRHAQQASDLDTLALLTE
jgi:aminoglycoside/choline kinase family phosphotransferase